MPMPVLPRSNAPVTSVPMKLPTIRAFWLVPKKLIPSWKRLITSPRTVTFGPPMSRPVALAPAEVPSSSTIGGPIQPGCVVPSITTSSRICGSADAGWIVIVPLGTTEKRI